MENYKTLRQIANECCIDIGVVQRISIKEEMIPYKFIFTNKHFYNNEQESKIHKILFFEGRIDCIILPSKINTMKF